MEFGRRKFVVSMAGLGALIAAGGWSVFRRPSLGFLIGASGREFICVDLRTNKLKSISAINLAHSFVVWPHKKACALAPEKSGNKMSLVNFENGTVEKVITAPASRLFYGHLAMASDNSVFYSSQVDTVSGAGFLVTYNSRNFSIIDETQICPGGIHDISFVRGQDDRLAFTSSGVRHTYDGAFTVGHHESTRVEPSTIQIYDLKARKIIRSYPLDDDSMIFGHLKTLSDGTIAAITTLFDGYQGISKTKSGSVFLLNSDGIRKLPVPENVRAQMNHELLTVAADQENRVLFATNPIGQKTLIYEIPSGRLLDVWSSDTNGATYAPLNDKWYISSQKTPAIQADNIVDLSNMAHLTSSHFTWAPPDFFQRPQT